MAILLNILKCWLLFIMFSYTVDASVENVLNYVKCLKHKKETGEDVKMTYTTAWRCIYNNIKEIHRLRKEL